MREVITIQILRPNFEDMHPKVKAELIEQMAKDIAKQITTQETIRQKNEDTAYWQDMFVKWEVENILIRQRYAEEYKRSKQ